jgi:hypothetical protein
VLVAESVVHLSEDDEPVKGLEKLYGAASAQVCVPIVEVI